MTVRLSDLATEHIDSLIQEGLFDSRASYLTWLVEREAQRAQAWLDLQHMREQGTLDDADSAAIIKATSGRPLSYLD